MDNQSWWWIGFLDLGLIVVLWFFVVLLETLGGEPLSPPSALTWIALAGAAIGVASADLLANRVLPPGPFPGLSVIATPPLFGLAMEVLGRLQERRGLRRRHLETWYGGAVFGLGLAVGRLSGLHYFGAL